MGTGARSQRHFVGAIAGDGRLVRRALELVTGPPHHAVDHITHASPRRNLSPGPCDDAGNHGRGWPVSGLGFSSTPWIAAGPFDWTREAAGGDRRRLATQRALCKLMGALRGRGAPSLSLRLKKVVGGYGEPLVARSADVGIAFDGFDRYWVQVFFRRDFYEPDMYRLFERAKRIA